MDEQRDKIKDLEVKDEDARDIAGGKRKDKRSVAGKSGARRALTVPPIAGKKER